MKIYTRTGDDGTTGLFGGERRRKDAPRVEAYGDVDELNAMIGAARAMSPLDPQIDDLLSRIQSALFTLGADLATPLDKNRKNITIPRVTADMIACLESEIDRFEERLAPLKNFVLPGGTPAGALLHVARTVCRRAERRVTSLASLEPEIGTEIGRYINRLSDLLFVLARAVNADGNRPEEPWAGGRD